MDILVVDDEALARERLQRLLADEPEHRVVATASHGQAALEAIQQYDPDVVLLDVRMPEVDGLDVARQLLALEDPPAVVFCTAYDDYALAAFDVEAAGYLMKPVKREQLQQVLEKCCRLNKAQRSALQQEDSMPAAGRHHISANTRRGVELVALDDVRYFAADHKYVTAYHIQGELLIDETLKELEAEFGERFVRVHRNALVSLQHIEAMEKTEQGYIVRLLDIDATPTVSRRHVSPLREKLQLL